MDKMWRVLTSDTLQGTVRPYPTKLEVRVQSSTQTNVPAIVRDMAQFPGQ